MSKRCNQCEALVINGVFCHEHGCPNERKKFVDDEWVEPETELEPEPPDYKPNIKEEFEEEIFEMLGSLELTRTNLNDVSIQELKDAIIGFLEEKAEPVESLFNPDEETDLIAVVLPWTK